MVSLAAQLRTGGTPDPLDARRHRPVSGGTLEAGAAFVNLDVDDTIVPIAGALAVRVRGLFTGGGTLSFSYLRPPPFEGTAYTVSNPPSVVVVANTEFVTTFEPQGESLVRIRFTASATGVVTYLDVMQV